MELVDRLKHCQNRGIPLLGVTSLDPGEVIQAARALPETAVITWTAGTGFSPGNPLGLQVLQSCFSQGQNDPYASQAPDDFSQFREPGEALREAQKFNSQDCILIMIHAHRWLNDFQAASSLWVLRDLFKEKGNLCILQGPSLQFPVELQSDVIMVDAPLPSRERLGEITTEVHSWAQLESPSGQALESVLDALTGTSEFGAEQTLAYSLSSSGLDLQELWRQKIKLIEQTSGLEVWKNPVSLDQIGGCSRVKDFLKKIIPESGFKGVFWLDEVEKMVANSRTDNTGIMQALLGMFLAWTQDNLVQGALLYGIPGSGKSAIAKAAGSLTPLTIRGDLGAVQSKYPGESQAKMKILLKTVESVTQGKPLMLATCNSLDALPSEVIRRFRLGIFFFDLPDSEEKETIWRIHTAKYGINPDQEFPTDEGWTGADIETCCELARNSKQSLTDSASEVLPFAVSNPQIVQGLRAQAHNKFKAASYPGLYQMPQMETGRKIRLEGGK